MLPIRRYWNWSSTIYSHTELHGAKTVVLLVLGFATHFELLSKMVCVSVPELKCFNLCFLIFISESVVDGDPGL